MSLRRLRETVFSKFRPVREHNLPILNKGIGTPTAEYAETGPYHCADCIYLIKRGSKGKVGLCDEIHMKRDPKTKKDKDGHAIVKLQTGCCRFVVSKQSEKEAWQTQA